MNEAEWSKWIEWKGGECPVDGGETVQVLRQGQIVEHETQARNMRWVHLGSGYDDIVAYRTQRKTLALPVKDMAGDKHSHYFKDVSKLDRLDVYRLLALFEVSDPALQHIIKKALCAGKRGAKDFAKDVREIADTANRRVQMLVEDGL